MKSLTAVCQTGASMPAINPNGRISRHPPHRGDGESAEMKMYLSKLKDLVPFMPKNRKLSKLEIIQHVIDYICDLQSELEAHPEISNFDAAAALNFTSNLDRVSPPSGRNDDDNGEDAEEDDEMPDDVQERLNGNVQQQSSPAQRQPLVDRQTPNTILPATQQQNLHHQAVNNTSLTHTTTSTSSAANNTSNTTAATSSSTAVTTNLSSHTLSNEKAIDRSSSTSSRQSY